jgi:hypothetical protein
MDLSLVPEHDRRVATYESFKVLGNGRIRYYGTYKPSKSAGRTAGARLVVEVDATSGQPIRTWYESYDAAGRVIRVHPKTPVDLGHIEMNPETGKEIERW